MDNNNENIGQGAPVENPAQTLANMPEFNQFRAEVEAKQNKSFAEARQSGELPEGVRDENDYQEYMAEQKARAKENENLDNKLFEDIKSIEDPNDRDLTTAILPFYYNSLIQHENGGKINVMHSAMRDTMQSIVAYMNGNKTDSRGVREVIFKESKSYFDKNHDVANKIISIIDGNEKKPSILDQLTEGQEIENVDLSEINFKKGFNANPYQFTLKIGKGIRKTTNFNIDGLSSAKEEQRHATKIVLSMANNLVRKMNEANNAEDHQIAKQKINRLREISWTPDGDVEKAFMQRKENRLKAFANHVEDIMSSANFDKRNGIPFDHFLISLISEKELSDEFARRKESQSAYNHSLQLGKKLLDGENWQNIDADDVYKSREISSINSFEQQLR